MSLPPNRPPASGVPRQQTGSAGPVRLPQRRSFYDREVQGLFWQAVVISVVLAIAAFLVLNTLHNLETRNIKTGYDFLGREAGFEIGETLVEYSPAANYARALEVGFLNTLHVAALGIVLATVAGVLIGIATLSSNWLVANLAGAYVHLLRNIPVLLQIILWYTILISERFLPHPRQAEPVLGIFATQRGLYFPTPEWQMGWTFALTGLAAGLAFLIGLLGKRRSSPPATDTPVWREYVWYPVAFAVFLALPTALEVSMWTISATIAAIQSLLTPIGVGADWLNTPRDFLAYLVSRFAGLLVIAWPAAFGLLAGLACARFAQRRQDVTGKAIPLIEIGLAVTIVLVLVGWLAGGAPTAMSWPALRGFNISGGTRITPEFAAVLFGLTVYTSAFIAEIVRSGILAVPKGQIEAARALGLKESVILRKITLPQALRVIVPPLTSQYLNLTKNSSLSVAVGYPDLVNVANTTINQTGQAIEGISVIMLVYLATSLATSAFMNWYNARIALVER